MRVRRGEGGNSTPFPLRTTTLIYLASPSLAGGKSFHLGRGTKVGVWSGRPQIFLFSSDGEISICHLLAVSSAHYVKHCLHYVL